MPEPIFYVRGFQPPLVEFLTSNKEMVQDLKIIAALSDDQVHALRQSLSEARGFLDPKTLPSTIREVIQDANVAEAVRRALRAFTPPDVERLLRSLEEQRKKKGFPFEPEMFDRLKQVLPELIKPYPGLVRFKKAERLATVTGNELESIELICDLRPIFDEGREIIEGMMPYTRLRIVVTGVDGLPQSFEAQLTREDLDDLVEKANKAKKKFGVLSQSVQTWIPGGLPDLPLTRSRKDSKDE